MQIDLTLEARRILVGLLQTGLYGQTEADVAERIFYEKLREIKARGEDDNKVKQYP